MNIPFDAWWSPENAFLVCFWAAAAGVLSMVCYRRFSNQESLAELQAELDDVQNQLKSYEGEPSGMFGLVRTTLQLAGRRVTMALGPSLAAAVPLVLLLLCLGVQIDISVRQRAEVERMSLVQGDQIIPVSATAEPTPTLAATQPAEYLPVGPDWMRSWMVLFMGVSTVSALVFRQAMGIL